MSSSIRHQVLNTFKRLHRTRQRVFEGDSHALRCSRQEINKQFRINKSESDEDAIRKMIKLAEDVEHELRVNVIQAREKSEGLYELRIRPETQRFDNVLFNPNADIPSRPSKRTKCCKEEQQEEKEASAPAQSKETETLK